MSADQLEPEIPVAERLRFGPNESPYSGVREAIARIRRGASELDKYLGAIERDVEVFEREWASARGRMPGSSGPPPRVTGRAADDEGSGGRPDDEPTADQRPGKSWRNG